MFSGWILRFPVGDEVDGMVELSPGAPSAIVAAGVGAVLLETSSTLPRQFHTQESLPAREEMNGRGTGYRGLRTHRSDVIFLAFRYCEVVE